MNMSYSKKTVIWSLCAALCVVLPQTLRVIPNADAAYKAMQMPVILCGMLCGPGGGLFCAAAGVTVSVFISGVPVAPMFPVVLTELALMGIISGLITKVFSGSRGGGVLYSVIFAILLGRCGGGAVAALLYSPGQESLLMWVWGYIIAGLPSFVVELILLPAIIKALEYSGLICIAPVKTVAPVVAVDTGESGA